MLIAMTAVYLLTLAYLRSIRGYYATEFGTE